MLIKQPSSFSAVIRQKRQLFSHFENQKSTRQSQQSNSEDHCVKTQEKYFALEQTVAQVDGNQLEAVKIQFLRDDKDKKHCSFSIEEQIIHSLCCIKYQQSYFDELLTRFLAIVGNHIKIKEHIPHAESLIGANLLTNGIFHELWINILQKQNLNFSILKPKYYEDFKHAIKKNYENFERVLFGQHSQDENIDLKQNVKEKIKFMKEKNQYDVKEQNNIKQEKIEQDTATQLTKFDTNFLEPNQQPTQIFDGLNPNYMNQLKLEDQKSVNSQINFPRKANKQAFEKEEEEGIVINTALLKFIQINKRRLNAQIVCNFFSIPSHRTFSIRQIKIQEILEMKKEKKFQYAVLLGKNINKFIKFDGKTVNNDSKATKHQSKSHIFISCYNYINLEQLIRIQLTYQKIYGFIAYEYFTDFYGYLDKFEREKSEKNKSIEKGIISFSKERKE